MVTKGDENEDSLQARIRILRGKLRNSYRNIQLLKEQPELSSEGWESDLSHRELFTSKGVHRMDPGLIYAVRKHHLQEKKDVMMRLCHTLQSSAWGLSS